MTKHFVSENVRCRGKNLIQGVFNLMTVVGASVIRMIGILTLIVCAKSCVRQHKVTSSSTKIEVWRSLFCSRNVFLLKAFIYKMPTTATVICSSSMSLCNSLKWINKRYCQIQQTFLACWITNTMRLNNDSCTRVRLQVISSNNRKLTALFAKLKCQLRWITLRKKFNWIER